ncbi:polysaccharide deacetylase family protein [Arthrobacter sp. 1P04PC]|uniref:polysaccharide deacetylase family protein n=1 Tax=unclassified Arthrobacter TaxID=235627 RepID=UPI0039A2D213
MWTIPAGGQRRLLAAALAVLLVAAAVAGAVLLASGPRGSGPQGGPPATAPLPPTSSSPSSATTTVSPSPATSSSAPESPTPAPPAPEPPAPPESAPPAPEPPAPPAPEPPVPPAAPFPAALRGADVEVIPGAGPVVALTFDAGANSAGLPSILQTLSATGVRGTFFLTGAWASGNPAGVAAIVAGGHRIGNHSMTHPGFTGLSDAQITEQLAGAESAINVGGGTARPLFRFPFGERDARTIAAVNALGYVAVRWSVDTLGWKGTSGGISVQTVLDRTLAGLRPGEIVLMHIGSNPDDGSTLDADALPQLISRLRAAGYGFTTLDALLR